MNRAHSCQSTRPRRRSGEREILIGLTSGAINALDADELAYVIGHELGHALLGHLDTRVLSDAELSGLVQLGRLALSRYQELSADRVGLLCCPDVLAKVRALPLEEQQVRIVELAEQLTLALPPAKRHRIVEDLTLIAEDGKVSDAERQAIDGIAGLLGVGPFAAGDTLAELAAGLD